MHCIRYNQWFTGLSGNKVSLCITSGNDIVRYSSDKKCNFFTLKFLLYVFLNHTKYEDANSILCIKGS